MKLMNNLNETIEKEINEICTIQNKNKTILVLPGGGMNGLILLGAVKYLEELDILKHIEIFAGTSIGLIISVFLIAGYRSIDIYKFTKLFDMTKSINLDITNLFTTYSINKCDYYEIILTEILKNKKAVILNPAYTLLFQSKAILKILWELYPNHPLLLETSFQSILGKTCVEKVLFGREGANVRIITPSGTTETSTEGEYFEQKTVFQEYTEFIKDTAGNSREAFHYQAGVFFVGEACGLGFRRGGKILDNKAQFCGHLIEG